MVTVCEDSSRLVPSQSAMPGPSIALHSPNVPCSAPADYVMDSRAHSNLVPSVSMQDLNMDIVDIDKMPSSVDDGRCSDEVSCRIVEELPSSTDAQ